MAFKVITRFILKFKIRRDNLTRKRKFISWDKVEKIALIIEKHNSLNKSAIDKLLEESKKYIEVFYIETDSKEHTFGDWNCFSKKDKSLLNLPKKFNLNELTLKNFDIVINTCDENNLFATALALSIQAQLKCGENKSFDLADLIITKKQADNLKNYLDDTFKYLRMIKA
ncbi:DUF6913 domain-containing protein [Aurantibacillus circumpalustris]|uniref:DUF6913 domain-containing protein n=1 Tax=Aurantibacillus circumpalustris TaxID=3036359 RepID=UPI00295C024D|nr:hypothetical protein [Aurantibacillus circumpalustris]